MIATFTRREKPGQRAARIAGKKVDPAVVQAIKRAFGSEGVASTGGAPKAMTKMPGANTHQKPWDTMGSDYYK